MSRRIAHLDMDAFYASVELLRYPELCGQPVVIGGSGEREPTLGSNGARLFGKLKNYAGRGVVTTATYEARTFGISSGMGLMKAARLAPDAILLPADFQRYRHYSQLFKTAVAAVTPRIEDHGIDEIYIDLTGLSIGAAVIARRIKRAVQEATGLSCSIAVAPNKLLSKICSDLEKPDGLTILDPEEIATRIWPLPVKKVNGIGPIAARKLDALGISTIGQLAGADLCLLQLNFGSSSGRWLYEVSHGVDDRPVIINPEPRSLSRETTFERDLHPRYDRSFLSGIFTGLCADLAKDLQRKGYVARTIGIKLRFQDFQTVTRASTLLVPTAEPITIRRAAELCLRRVSLDRRLRLLGVRATALSAGSLSQEPAVSRQKELPLS